MFIDTRMIPRPALQEERHVLPMKCGIDYVSLLRSEENLFKLVFYKHFVPTGRGAMPKLQHRHKSRQKNKNDPTLKI